MKKSIKFILLLILGLALISPVLASCKDNNADNSQPDTEENQPNNPDDKGESGDTGWLPWV